MFVVSKQLQQAPAVLTNISQVWKFVLKFIYTAAKVALSWQVLKRLNILFCSLKHTSLAQFLPMCKWAWSDERCRFLLKGLNCTTKGKSCCLHSNAFFKVSKRFDGLDNSSMWTFWICASTANDKNRFSMFFKRKIYIEHILKWIIGLIEFSSWLGLIWHSNPRG